MSSGLPSGVVTFLFTDIEGSTALLRELGPVSYGAALGEHRRVVRAAIVKHRGVEVGTEGDAFFAVFADPGQAVAAAEAAQRSLSDGPVRVRMGLHTGSPLLGPEGYVGEDVHLGARVAAAGHGGQVLISAATRGAIEAEVTDLGEHRLKDFAEPVSIFQLGSERFPPLKTISNTNLPRPASSFVGRARELEDLVALVRGGARLVTLVGPGGSGKSRLAIEAASSVLPEFKAGAFWVELAPLRDPGLVVGAISRTLGIERVPAQDPLDTLVGALRSRELLLALDNAEHLRAAARVFGELLARAPHLSLLVTSRAVLNVSGEHVYPVQPLAERAAVALFCDRARAADPRFDPEAADDESVRRICVRLDGLPLAIELAAARTRTLLPEALLEHLDRRLPLLTGGPRDAPARQQTLRSTLEWSFGLLAPAEAQLAMRLGVFVGSFDLAAAAAVCDTDLDGLTSLLEQSLLERTADGRFFYLETIREYALERLEQSPEADQLRERHLRFFLEVARSADLTATIRLGRERFEIASAAQDNLRAALAWSAATGPVSPGLELATAMERFWVTHDPREGMRWFQALLDRPDAAAVAPVIRANALRAYGSAADIAGEDEKASRLYQQSLAAFEQLGDQAGRAVLLHRLGLSALRRGDLAGAQELVEHSHAIHERADDRWGQAQTLAALGAIARDAGDEINAYRLINQSATLAREAGVRWWEGGMLAELANLSLNAGRTDDGEQQAGESLALAEQIGDRAGRVFGVGLFARIAATRGQTQRALSLWAAVANEHAVAPLGGWQRHRSSYQAKIHEMAGVDLDFTHDQTSALTLDEAVTSILATQR